MTENYDPTAPHPATTYCNCGWWGMVWSLVKDNRCPICNSGIHVPYDPKKFLEHPDEEVTVHTGAFFHAQEKESLSEKGCV